MRVTVRPLAERPQAATRLFCFPYAGGGASAFRGWAAALPADIEPWSVQLPGREDQLGAPLFDRMGAVLNVLVPSVIPHLDRPFAFFGHSMGALVAWSLTRALQRMEIGSPTRLFVSGCVPPQAREETAYHAGPEKELIGKLRSWSATPEAVLADPELMRLMLPVIRADLAVVETYRFTGGPLLTCPVTAFGGTEDDPAGTAVMPRWGELTAGGFDLRMFPGGHFFLHSARPAVLAEIAGRLAAVPWQNRH
ncbi:Linear gramicidin dehydrogenase LgrE [Streptomyces sp. ADI95-16]|uniref:thioesterase II family protein n=1 Tax=Streptomyces sp. ADI95-16 TaxID=1522758 RepID=UPI000F3A8F5E|nr:alpha/beta fold hydrolase [Streptomyces sp. ADI95-16]AYV31155.1 Linear gramicidin dehydrogenase LgrE [Streptomyces sp. ADI95-16]